MSLPKDAATRKATPIATGFVDYFPDAMAEVATLSRIGNDQHNPGKPLHWDRSKSTDEADSLLRHFMERGTIDVDGVRHSAKVAWRAMALLQKEIEASRAEPEPTGAQRARFDGLGTSPAALALAIGKPESKFGFTVGDAVETTSNRTRRPGRIVGFNDFRVLVRWQDDSVGYWTADKLVRLG